MIEISRSTISKKQKTEEKQLYGYFKRQTGEISHEKTGTGLRKGNFDQKSESLRIESQNNAIWTNYVKGKLDKYATK